MSSSPTPAPWSGPLPPAEPPATVRLFQLPTGTYETRAAFAVTGGRFRDRRRFAATSVLVQHPAGDLLIDAGFGADLAEHVRLLPRIERAPYERGRTAREQLDAVGYDLSRLRGVLVTHVHWDHVSGLDSLDAPVWLTAAERAYGATDPHGAVFRAVSAGREIREYALDGPPYLGFPASHDVHGDGSVVVARAGGHTPGSVVVFVCLPTGERYGFIGDLTWQLDGLERRAERPWLLRRLADVDAAVVRTGLDRSIALRDVVHVVPSHDVAAYASIPVLGPVDVQGGVRS
ncbi:MBL fold metallo-hydrolase [Cellulomonas cellasea]|uniref:Glyoxylase-like metal-dependent hydrolase (Beta-lactamase superfamily II) n=1 Tax=Cellulomonas cellasea TaxID=43670 RepID=A0A7W4UFY5_9CELL|nr:MBL fold metallo-hydrolase [Cellulomonas cellasea]MBB2923444.1 glyoxylase-like metal-dependent hydrolase (beta-lactamase superfamily II) [Cellulomonas cellasea]